MKDKVNGKNPMQEDSESEVYLRVSYKHESTPYHRLRRNLMR